MNQTKPSRKAPLKVLNRVLRYMLHYYALPFTLVIVCILITAVATVTGATFPQKLVDDYIVPMPGRHPGGGRRHGLLLQPHHGLGEPGHHAPAPG